MRELLCGFSTCKWKLLRGIIVWLYFPYIFINDIHIIGYKRHYFDQLCKLSSFYGNIILNLNQGNDNHFNSFFPQAKLVGLNDNHNLSIPGKKSTETSVSTSLNVFVEKKKENEEENDDVCWNASSTDIL